MCGFELISSVSSLQPETPTEVALGKTFGHRCVNLGYNSSDYTQFSLILEHR